MQGIIAGIGTLLAMGAHGPFGRLLPVLTPWQPPAVEVFAVFPSNRYLTPKVRAFVDLALEMFPRPISG